MTALGNTTGLILAGGAGRRVGGRDKGLIHWQGQPLIAHVAERLRPQVGRLLISCNRNFEEYAKIAGVTIADIREDFQGPLAGLEAAAPHVHTDFLIVCACDIPRLPENLAQRLVEPLKTQAGDAADISIAFDGHRQQYLCAAIRSHCLATLPAYLAQGQRAVRHWYSTYRCVTVSFSEQPESFRNFNYMEQA